MVKGGNDCLDGVASRRHNEDSIVGVCWIATSSIIVFPHSMSLRKNMKILSVLSAIVAYSQRSREKPLDNSVQEPRDFCQPSTQLHD